VVGYRAPPAVASIHGFVGRCGRMFRRSNARDIGSRNERVRRCLSAVAQCRTGLSALS
jgi:hypothetical protein